MDNRLYRGIGRVSRWLNNLAAISLFITMVLVVANIILRALFAMPIKATYDYVGFFTATAIGLALAYCAWEDGHISIHFLMQRLPKRVQQVIDLIIGLFNLLLIFTVAYQVASYAYTLHVRGEVGLSSGVPHAPFILLIAVGIGVMGLVVFIKLFPRRDKGSEDR